MKSVLYSFRPIFLRLLCIFFDKTHLSGRFFEQSAGGFVWATKAIWTRNILRLGRPYPWPVHFSTTISNPANIDFHPDDLNNFQSRNVYFQCVKGKIRLGRGCYIAPNVGFITQNHDPSDLNKHLPAQDIVIGAECWIGMNSVILPGVTLGEGTLVAAGSVVNSSFPDGHILIGGTPAKQIKSLQPRG